MLFLTVVQYIIYLLNIQLLPHYIHCYVVGDELIVKISDFGLTRAIHNTEFYKIQRPAQFQFRWLAPECILYGIFTLKSDIWWVHTSVVATYHISYNLV